MREFRDLKKAEEEALFAVYCKYKGNMTQLGKSGEANMNRNMVAFYAKKFDFKTRMLRNVAENAEKAVDTMNSILTDGKKKAIMAAVKLLEPRIKIIELADGTTKEIKVNPGSKEVKTAWEIIKTELGEPTSINQNNNKNEDVEKIDETRNTLNNLIKDVKAGTAKDTRK